MGYPGDKQTLVRTQYTPQSADPPNPVVGQVFNSDGTSRAEGLWRYTSSNTWEQLGAGNSGSKNYVTNPNINGDTSGYTASSANVTVSEDTSTPLEGTGSIQMDILNTATTADYMEVSLDTFDRIDTEALNVIEISYDASSMESLNDVEIVAYDVTGAAELDTHAFSSFIDGKGKFIAQFTSTTSTDYTLRLKVAQVPTATSTLIIDEAKVGPYDKTYGVPTSDYMSFTPTWKDTVSDPTVGNGSLQGFYRRDGDSIDLRIFLEIGSTTNLGSGTEWSFGIPAGLAFDFSKSPEFAGFEYLSGDGWIFSNTLANRQVTSVGYKSGSNNEVVIFTTGASTIDGSNPFSWTTGDRLIFNFKAPILGWSSEVNIVNGRKVNPTFGAYLDTNTVTSAGSNTIAFDTVTQDNFAGYSTNNYEVPETGRYFVQGKVMFTSEVGNLVNVGISVINNAETIVVDSYNGDYFATGGVSGLDVSNEIYVEKGQKIRIDVFDQSGGNTMFGAGGGTTKYTFVSISKVPDQVEAIVGIEPPRLYKAEQNGFVAYPITVGQWGDLASIDLPQGTYDISGMVSFSGTSVAASRISSGTGNTSGNNGPLMESATRHDGTTNAAHTTTFVQNGVEIGVGGETYYLKARSLDSVTNYTVEYVIYAREVK